MTNQKITSKIYFGSDVKVGCDVLCNKAWGVVCRPNKQLSDDIDDIFILSDEELDEAPIDPGTYEGGDAKPEYHDFAHNKWCVRQCERCVMGDSEEEVLKLIEEKTKQLKAGFHNIPNRDSNQIIENINDC